ncbi:MAG: universal stress protein [Rubricoccaceae bacterium]
MSQIRHILVPRDFSPPSESALVVALRLAARADATLHLVHVDVLAEDPYGTPSEAAGPATRLRERLKGLIDHDRSDGVPFDPKSVRMEHAVFHEVAAGPTIAQHAADIEADLIVMGRHARRGLGRAVLGSVAEHLVREAPCPVATVVPSDDAPDASIDAPPIVLCAVDLSEASATAVDLAAELAEGLGARLDLVHAAPSGSDAHERVDALAAEVTGKVEVRSDVRAGSPAEVIAEAISETSPALVVVGRRAGMARLLGSVSERIVKTVAVPVVVAPEDRAA